MKLKIETEGKYYACHEYEHDLYFSSLIEKGMERVLQKAKAMIKSKENFEKDFPQYKK